MNVKYVVTGNEFSMVFLQNSTVFGFGDNFYGQLGIFKK
jgi:alpha-tubulin suppressor-like RCC1 family protein